MAFNVNQHVLRLRDYLPFESGHEQIYEEHADPTQLKSLRTKAQERLLELVRSGCRLIVLTGDAGHGKTHLCRRVLEEAAGLDVNEAHQAITTHAIALAKEPAAEIDGQELWLATDLSELTGRAGLVLREGLARESATLIVCANEGKLREVISADPELQLVRSALEEAQQLGRTTAVDGVAILDLNFQSVVAECGDALLEQLLQQWVIDKRRWKPCETCAAALGCPIKRNRDELAGIDDDRSGAIRRDGLRMILAVAERTGTCITIRELLILVAYIVTADMGCEEVHRHYSEDPEKHHWQYRKRYFQLLFEKRLTRDQERSLQLLAALRRFDPGRIAVRAVDEALTGVEHEGADDFTPPPRSVMTPRSRTQARSEAQDHNEAFRFRRRRDFFDLSTHFQSSDLAAPALATPRSERIGFRFLEDFDFLLSDRESDSEIDRRRSIRDGLLRGMEAAQDMRRSKRQQSKFAVVDPAYGSVAGNASILAVFLAAKDIRIVPREVYWKILSDRTPDLASSVDWYGRSVTVILGRSPEQALHLDLVQFEFLMRSANGLSCRRFFEGEIRRIISRLALVTEGTNTGGEDIRVVYGDKLRTITIDEGNRIICEETA